MFTASNLTLCEPNTTLKYCTTSILAIKHYKCHIKFLKTVLIGSVDFIYDKSCVQLRERKGKTTELYKTHDTRFFAW